MPVDSDVELNSTNSIQFEQKEIEISYQGELDVADFVNFRSPSPFDAFDEFGSSQYVSYTISVVSFVPRVVILS